MSDSRSRRSPDPRANCASPRAGSRARRLAWALHDTGVRAGALALLMFVVGCIIPPSLSVDTADAGANSAPAIISVRADGVELPEFSTVNFEQGLGTLNLVVHDTDLDDTLFCKVFVDYNNPDPTPPRANSQTAGTTVDRTCTLDLAGLCLTADINQTRLMQVLVFDRMVLDTGEPPLYQAMAKNSGGISTSRTYFLRCQDRQI
jgi:hypothetical protein